MKISNLCIVYLATLVGASPFIYPSIACSQAQNTTTNSTNSTNPSDACGFIETNSTIATNTTITTSSSVSLPGLPSHCMDSVKGIAWGWLPDDLNTAVTISSLNAKTGKKACFFGVYSKINAASSYEGSDITSEASAAAAAGAIMVPSIMPVGVTWREITTTLASKIGTVVETFTKRGLVVYLRFAHEMNCYAKPGCATPAYPGGEDYTGFRQAWANVAKVCRGIHGCYMMWSPNLQDVASMHHWWPGAEHVDVVAVDHYPESDHDVDEGFGGAYGEFYGAVVHKHGKPFMLGETAYGGSMAMKDQWVKHITKSDFRDYPLYKGAMWFE